MTDNIKFPVYYDPRGQYIFDAENKMIADVRGWGWIQKLDNPEQKQDHLGEWIARAMNFYVKEDQNALFDGLNEQLCIDEKGE